MEGAGEKRRTARKGKGLIALHRGHESNAEVSPQIKTPCGSSSVSRQHERLCSRACITTWLEACTAGETISRSGNECRRLSIESTEGRRRHFSRPQINLATPPQQAGYCECLLVGFGDNNTVKLTCGGIILCWFWRGGASSLGSHDILWY